MKQGSSASGKPKTLNTHTHTHKLLQSWYKSLGPLILRIITCIFKSLDSISFIWVLIYKSANGSPKTLKTIQ